MCMTNTTETRMKRRTMKTERFTMKNREEEQKYL